MMLSIAILLGVSWILNLIYKEGNANLLQASALVISLWNLCLPLAIIVIVITIIGGLIWSYNN